MEINIPVADAGPKDCPEHCLCQREVFASWSTIWFDCKVTVQAR
jgi:hypothetical protein